jgi:hypothetical protein
MGKKKKAKELSWTESSSIPSEFRLQRRGKMENGHNHT